MATGDTSAAAGGTPPGAGAGFVDRARRVFLAWEKLRVIYVALLAAPTLWVALERWGDPDVMTHFPVTVVLGAAFANLAYFLGPAVEVYLGWLGFRHWGVRAVLFTAGTLFALLLTLLVLSDFVSAGF